MQYRAKFTASSGIRTKHIDTLCGQHVDSLNFKTGGTYSNRQAL